MQTSGPLAAEPSPLSHQRPEDGGFVPLSAINRICENVCLFSLSLFEENNHVRTSVVSSTATSLVSASRPWADARRSPRAAASGSIGGSGCARLCDRCLRQPHRPHHTGYDCDRDSDGHGDAFPRLQREDGTDHSCTCGGI